MRRLCSLLGMPQHRFASIHVVGTNGKTSVARMTMALLEAHGVSAGAYVSPHIVSSRERILIRGEPIAEEALTQVLERAEHSARVADRSAGDEGPVTQFELVTAAAFLAFAEARVEVAAIEAGLGGRLDATNVIPSKVTVLTSVGLDHTEWLGEALEQIAAEKLAVLRDHTTLITGVQPPEVEPVVEREVDRRHARRIDPRGEWLAPGTTDAPEGSRPLSGYQRGNLLLARAAAAQFLGRSPSVETMLPALSVPGRAEFIPGDPPAIFDAAHNPAGASALAELLPELVPPRESRAGPMKRVLKLFPRMAGKRVRSPSDADPGAREVVCCLAVLAEKDAEGIVRPLAEVCSRFVCTQIPAEAIRGSGRPVGSSHPAAVLAELCRAAGAEAEAIEDALEAWARTRELARERDGVALAAGSHYLLSCIWTERHAPSS